MDKVYLLYDTKDTNIFNPLKALKDELEQDEFVESVYDAIDGENFERLMEADYLFVVINNDNDLVKRRLLNSIDYFQNEIKWKRKKGGRVILVAPNRIKPDELSNRFRSCPFLPYSGINGVSDFLDKVADEDIEDKSIKITSGLAYKPRVFKFDRVEYKPQNINQSARVEYKPKPVTVQTRVLYTPKEIKIAEKVIYNPPPIEVKTFNINEKREQKPHFHYNSKVDEHNTERKGLYYKKSAGAYNKRAGHYKKGIGNYNSNASVNILDSSNAEPNSSAKNSYSSPSPFGAYDNSSKYPANYGAKRNAYTKNKKSANSGCAGVVFFIIFMIVFVTIVLASVLSDANSSLMPVVFDSITTVQSNISFADISLLSL